MSGLSADVDPKLTDLALIMNGGANFMARMIALKDQQLATAQQLADLNLGVDLHRGLEEVKARLKAAQATLAQAQVQAQSIEATARAAADALISGAREQLAEAEAYGREYFVKTQEHADDLLRDAQMRHAEAITLRNEAERLEQQTRVLRDDLQHQIDEHRLAVETLDRLRTDVVQKRNLLIEAIRQASGIV